MAAVFSEMNSPEAKAEDLASSLHTDWATVPHPPPTASMTMGKSLCLGPDTWRACPGDHVCGLVRGDHRHRITRSVGQDLQPQATGDGKIPGGGGGLGRRYI